MKTRSLLFLTLIVFITETVVGQQNYYWIKFKDKQYSSFNIDEPERFLSRRALDRKIRQFIPVDEYDLPVSTGYVDGILPFVTEIKHKLRWLNLVIAKIDNPANIDSIKSLSFVDSINLIQYLPARVGKTKYEEHFYAVDEASPFSTNYGPAYNQIQMLSGDLLHQLNYKGEGMLICVMDNGFFRVNTIAGFDSIRNNISYTYDFVNNENNVYNDGSHGTNVLSCIGGNIKNKFLGTAPHASFLLMVTEDDGAEWVMEEYNWAAAAEWADSAGADILTTSLGYTLFDGDIGSHQFSDLDGNKTVITRAANIAFSRGMMVINSAGNEGNSSWYHISAPADGYNVLAVGAVDSTRQIASFSGRGPNSSGRVKPDVCAQGVRSAVITNEGNMAFSGGTSFSCPILAGAVACLWQAFPDMNVYQLYDLILSSGDHHDSIDNAYGHGVVNFHNAYLSHKMNYNSRILKMNDSVTVFPSPFSGELYTSLYSKESNSYKIELINMNGERVAEKDIVTRPNSYNIIPIIESDHILPGVYYLRVNGDRAKTFPVVKAK